LKLSLVLVVSVALLAESAPFHDDSWVEQETEDPRLEFAASLIVLHEPSDNAEVHNFKALVQKSAPELYKKAMNLHFMNDAAKRELLEDHARWGFIKKGFNAVKKKASGWWNKNKGNLLNKAKGFATGMWNKHKGALIGKAKQWAKGAINKYAPAAVKQAANGAVDGWANKASSIGEAEGGGGGYGEGEGYTN